METISLLWEGSIYTCGLSSMNTDFTDPKKLQVKDLWVEGLTWLKFGIYFMELVRAGNKKGWDCYHNLLWVRAGMSKPRQPAHLATT